jgi:hypothetical protein
MRGRISVDTLRLEAPVVDAPIEACPLKASV